MLKFNKTNIRKMIEYSGYRKVDNIEKVERNSNIICYRITFHNMDNAILKHKILINQAQWKEQQQYCEIVGINY